MASNTVQGPYQALIPDQVPEAQRGQASGLKAMLEILAFVVGRQVSGRLVAAANEVGAVSAAAGAFVIALAVTALAAREGREAAVVRRSAREALLGAFNVDWKAHPAFVWWFVNRFLFWAGFIALQTFLLFFVIDVVGMVEARAQTFVGNLSTFIGLALLMVTLPSGWLADRLGRKPLVIGAGFAAAAGAALLMASRSTGMITLAGVIIGLGVGVFISASWALATDIVPQAEAARYLGVANIATAGGSGASRLMGGLLIDPLNAALGPAVGYMIVYGVAGAFFFFSALALMRLPAPAARPAPAA